MGLLPAAGAALVLGAAIGCTFSRLLAGPVVYLQYDDEKNYEEVPQLHSLIHTLRWVLEDGVILGVWEPVALLFKAGWHVASGGGGPRVCFAINVALHTLNALGATQLLLGSESGGQGGEAWRGSPWASA